MDGIMSLVVASLERRPQTVRQLSAALGLAEGDIRRVVQTLVREKKIQAKAALDDVFYLG
jgi:DNA-binding IclR family transcriptional regulator